MKNGSNVIICL